MKMIHFIVWLMAGAIVGWFAHRMVEVEQRRILSPILADEDQSIEVKY